MFAELFLPVDFAGVSWVGDALDDLDELLFVEFDGDNIVEIFSIECVGYEEKAFDFSAFVDKDDESEGYEDYATKEDFNFPVFMEEDLVSEELECEDSEEYF